MMFTAAALSTLAVASLAVAAPSRLRQRDDIDVTILQYALTLEHLEAFFYSDALSKYADTDFESAGFPAWVRRRVVQISQHETQHVSFLTTAIGDGATAACEYSFPYTDVTSFLGLAATIENVGVDAYLGAAGKITNPAYITAAGSILTTEARHQAWLESAVNKGAAWSGPEDTPLGFSPVYTIAAAFITSCPSTNPTLPVVQFPSASIDGTYAAGDTVHLTFETTGQTEYLVIYRGLSSFVELINVDHMVYLDSSLQGTAYGVITTASTAADVTDTNTVAGPIILNFGLTSYEVSA